ncbi:hypothetical protein GDO78_004936 [Eleutherodactylus coqui]|uniref:TGF-beta family profile domain-containing protein n=1 Tax=Eleutherodactylus coqui TaxID=57060 RepID=A0A8J6FKL8_ELECQ|nr:hypothetical protein GDO78_004936 [Eleutherodactylus coqui]
MAIKIIAYILIIPLVSGKPFLPPGTLPRDSSYPQGVKVPLYMMKLYKTLVENKDLKSPENHILETSDTVQSLTAKDFTVKENRLSLTFDLSPISRTDELQKAELRVHLPPLLKISNITVNIYYVKNGPNKHFLGSVMTNIPSTVNTTWTTFNITRLMENNLWGKQLTNHDEGEYSRKIKKRNVSPLEFTTDQALLVFFIKHNPYSPSNAPSLLNPLRTRRVNTMDMVAFHRPKRSHSEIQLEHPRSIYPMAVDQCKSSCRKVDMVVDFKELGWDNWVMYPKMYNAYRCEGNCNLLRKENSMTTNYDYIKSFKLKDSERTECSSCVPLKMQPLTMMLHENGHLVLRYPGNMMIEECGFR